MNSNTYLQTNELNSFEIDTFLSKLLVSQNSSERRIDKSFRKNTGTYLTSKLDTINNIIDIVPINSEIINKVILEPACGEGILILIFLIKIFKEYPNKNIFNKFISKNLIFVDINKDMIEKTKINICDLYKFLFNEEYKGGFNCYVYDFTKKFIENNNTLFAENNLQHPLAGFLGRVDYVIGNPPYISLYGRRDKKLNEQQRIYYLKNYDQFPPNIENGKINLVMLFLEHSMEFLKKNGELSFIIDISFFESAYKYTRKYLLENSKINSIELNIKDFEVASGQIILKLTKSRDNQINEVKLIDNQTKKIIHIKQNQWLNAPDEYKFRYNNYGKVDIILKKISKKRDKTILQIFPNKNLRTCTMLLNMEDKFTFTDIKDKDSKLLFPYYEGSKSLNEKYCELKFTKYFFYDKNLQDLINSQIKSELADRGIKNKKRIGFGEKTAYENPKVYIRQSAKKIIATLDFKRSSANNSLYIFTLKSDDTQAISELKFICGWLNSDLITFYTQVMNIIRFSNGKQPQIKISDLGSIPIPEDNLIKKRIIECVSRIYQDKKYIPEANLAINKYIYEYYNLDESEINFLQSKIKSF